MNKIIRKNPNPSGAYPPMQEWPHDAPPDGYALVPENIDTSVFYTHNGFVTLSISDGLVAEMTENKSAYQTWMDAHPVEPTTQPVEASDPVADLAETVSDLMIEVDKIKLGVTD